MFISDVQDKLAPIFLADFATFLINNRHRTARELMSFASDIGEAWLCARSECETPIEERLFEKILFIDDGVRPIRWSAVPSVMEDVKSEPQPDSIAVFCSQMKAGPYRVDFQFDLFTKPKRHTSLIVECDGHDWHHRTKEQARRDAARDRYLTRNGYRVLRFTGSEITADAGGCAQEIQAVIRSLLRELTGTEAQP